MKYTIWFLLLFFSNISQIFAFQKTNNFLVYYGSWDRAKIKLAHQYDLIILHPGKYGQNIKADLVRSLQAGPDQKKGTKDDILVIGYVSIGEDERIERGLRSNKKGYQGPTIYNPGGSSKLSYQGFRDWYIDEVKWLKNENGQPVWGENGLPKTEKGQDGLPDENGKWKSYFVNVNNPDWQQYIRIKMNQLIMNFGCDGLFLDTVDTASPWGNYGWMQKDMVQLLLKIRKWFPRKKLMMNRGLFLFEKYGKELNQHIDAVMFESFVSEWDWYRKIGTRHRWYRSNIDILKRHIQPLNQSRNGIKVFFLNYINPKQLNGLKFRYILQRDTSDIIANHYFSSPDLHQIYAPVKIEKLIPPRAKKLSYHIENHTPVLHIKEWLGKLPEIGQLVVSLNQFPFIKTKKHQNFKAKGWVNCVELENGIYPTQVTYLNPNGSPYLHAEFNITVQEKKPRPKKITNLQIESRDKAILIRWSTKKHPKDVVILWGSHSSNFDRTKIVQQSHEHLFNGLKQGHTYCFKVALLNQNQRGIMSDIYFASPNDCTPPQAPIIQRVYTEDQAIHIKYEPKSRDDLAGFYLYIYPENYIRGIPYKLPSYSRNWSVDIPVKGIYNIELSTFDANQNESEIIHAAKLKLP